MSGASDEMPFSKNEHGTRTILRAYISSKRAMAKKSLLSLKDPAGNYLMGEIDDTAPNKGGGPNSRERISPG